MTRTRLAVFALVSVFALTSVSVRAVAPANHIRVILDTSISLRETDPSGYVKLSTQILYELASGTHTPSDTFKVLQFQNDWQDWQKTGVKPTVPSLQQYLITPQWGPADHETFLRRIREIRYDAKQTYFSSCLQWALNDLRSAGGTDSNRVIVLITDGLSDFAAADGEALGLLKQQLHDAHIRLYVLAFSTKIVKNKGWFSQTLGVGQLDGVLGAVWEETDAKSLLSRILEIFSRSFGYSQETRTGTPRQIDLAGNASIERAAVVALSDRADNVAFELTSPSGTTLPSTFKQPGSPDPKGVKPEPVSYALSWLVAPTKGQYEFKPTGPAPTQVAILRPIRVEAIIRPRGGVPVDAVMAGKPTAMEVLVHSKDGGSGDPGANLRVKYYLHYLKPDDSSDPNAHQSQEGDGEGQLTPEGRVFVISPEFVPNPPGAGAIYNGYIEAVVEQYNTPVERSGDRMHAVRVYPYVAIRPTPPQARADVRGRELLGSGDEGCVRFQFDGNRSPLSDGAFTMGVRVSPPLALRGAFRGARLTMDGRELQDVSDQPGLWQARVPFSAGELGVKAHAFCVNVGRPASAASESLNVHFGLLLDSDPYYQQLNAVSPDLKVLVNIDAPGLWGRWGSWVMLLLSFLLTCLLVLLLRSRRTVPPDLAVSLGDGAGGLTPARLGEASIASRWLGLLHDRPVISLSGDTQIGSVRPLSRALFSFVPANGFGNLNAEENGEWRAVEPDEDGSILVSAGRVYRAGTGDRARFFRLDYSRKRPLV